MSSDQRERPGTAFRALAIATALATWALVAVGGMVRVSESGLGCPDWPLCDGRVVPASQKEPIIEYTHRATAGVVIVLLLLTAAWGLRWRASRRDVALPFALALLLVPVQALLGAIVVWLELPDRLVGVHFMVGMVMLSLATFGAVAAWRGTTAVTETFARTALVAGATGLLLISLGASVVATDGMHACGEGWPACNGGIVDGGAVAALQVAHRTTAYALTGIAVVLLALGLRGHAPLRIAGPLGAVALMQIVLGVGIVLSGHGAAAHDAFRALHVAGAGAVWATVVALVAVVTTAPVPQPAPSQAARADAARSASLGLGEVAG